MNEFNSGLKSYMDAIAADSSYAPAYLEAGRLYYRAGPIHIAEAAGKLEAHTGLRPDDPEGYVELGRALPKSNNPDDPTKATSTLRKDANFQLGFLYFARKDFPGAIPYFEAALKADSAFMPALLNIGLAKLAVKEPSAGIAYLRRALDVNPKENRARIWIAQTL